MSPPCLQTERLELQPPEARDFPAYRAFHAGRPGRGAGVATEASKAAIRLGDDDLGRAVVEIHMRDPNTSARKLAERRGGAVTRRETLPDGVTRDVVALPRPEDV